MATLYRAWLEGTTKTQANTKQTQAETRDGSRHCELFLRYCQARWKGPKSTVLPGLLVFYILYFFTWEESQDNDREARSEPDTLEIDLKSFIQGGFFNWPPPISVPKRKSLSSQSRPFLVTGFSGTAAVVGWLAVFFLVLKLGGWGWGAVKKTTLYMLMYSFLSPNIETLWWTESLNWVAFLANLDRKMYSHSAPKRGVAERK